MPTLYHYTTPSGLIGIVKSKSYWMSDTRFLNDSTELRYGISIFAQEIDKQKEEIIKIDEEALRYFEYIRNFNTSIDTRAYVASFSTEGDLLSQWRGYNAGRGYAIGNNSEHLRINANKQGYDLLKVIYDKNDQKIYAKGHISQLKSYLLKAQVTGESKQDALLRWLDDLLRIALQFKDKSFKEEGEYRLVKVGRGLSSDIDVRSSPTGIIPFLSCSFSHVAINSIPTDSRNFGIEKIIIGPALRENQIKSVDTLVGLQGMRFEISRSTIPYIID